MTEQQTRKATHQDGPYKGCLRRDASYTVTVSESQTREAIRDVASALNQMKQTTAEVLGLANTPETANAKKEREAAAAAKLGAKLATIRHGGAYYKEENQTEHEACADWFVKLATVKPEGITTLDSGFNSQIEEQEATAAAAAAAMDILRRTQHELAAIKAEATARAEVLQTVQAIEEVTK